MKLESLLIGLVVLFVACNPSGNGRSGQDSGNIIEHRKPLYAKGFDVYVLSDSTVRIILMNPASQQDTLQVIHWKKRPVSRIACLSTTHVPYIKALGHTEAIRAIGFADLMLDSEITDRIRNGQIVNLTSGHQLDEEMVYRTEPEIMFVYPFGGDDYKSYLESGIGCVQISEYLEQSPLGRSEWIKVFGVLLGRSTEADSIFNHIAAEYTALKSRVEELHPTGPSVFTGSYDAGNWFVPPGNSFAAAILKDAGARYIFADSLADVNLVIPFESLYQKAFDADYWGKIVHSDQYPDLAAMTGNDDRLLQMKSFKKRQLFFCNTATSDYHGKALLEPQVMLADLVKIFHPEMMMEHMPCYFQQWQPDSLQ